MKNGYRGYSNGPEGGGSFSLWQLPDETFKVPIHSYFALGDNSYHSRDSRDWGPVPGPNVAGRGLFVYLPFSSALGSYAEFSRSEIPTRHSKKVSSVVENPETSRYDPARSTRVTLTNEHTS